MKKKAPVHNFMKALVAEIHKDHCIAITRDGRFVRHDIPAGAYEIGDEIVIETAELNALRAVPKRRSFGILAKLSAGFAAIIILGGVTYLGIKNAPPGFVFGPVEVASQAAQAEQSKQAKTADLSGQEDTDGAYESFEKGQEQALAAEAPVSESDAAGSQSPESSADASKSAQSSSTSNQDSGQSDTALATQDSSCTASSDTNSAEEDIALSPEQVLYEGTFKLEKNNIAVLIDYRNLIITYKLGQAFSQDAGDDEIAAFTFKIKNLQKSTFKGNIDIIFTDKNGGILQTSTIETGNLDFNGEYTQTIQVAGNTDSFKMTLNGNFN